MGISADNDPAVVAAWLSGGRAPSERRGKYGNVPETTGGVRCDSRAEARRLRALSLAERAGAIEGLRVKPRYDLAVNGVRVCGFVPDFEYVRDGVRVVEDVKGGGARGTATAAFKIKARLFEAIEGVAVTVVDGDGREPS